MYNSHCDGFYEQMDPSSLDRSRSKCHSLHGRKKRTSQPHTSHARSQRQAPSQGNVTLTATLLLPSRLSSSQFSGPVVLVVVANVWYHSKQQSNAAPSSFLPIHPALFLFTSRTRRDPVDTLTSATCPDIEPARSTCSSRTGRRTRSSSTSWTYPS